MTATQLQSIALRLSNAGWCRHWLNLNSSHDNVWMAIQVLQAVACEDSDGGEIPFDPVEVPDLERLGFVVVSESISKFIYGIKRTNDDGTPYTSQLF